MKSMRNLGILKKLAWFGAFLTLISWVFDKHAWLSSALLNIGSGIFSSVILIYAYDLLLERQKEEERLEKQRRAIKSQKIILRQHYRVLLDCYRSSCTATNPPSFRDVNEFLGSHYEDVVAFLDLYAPSPMNSDGSVPYYQYIESSFTNLSNSLHSVLASSGDNLSSDIFAAIDNLINSEFMRVCQSLSALCNFSVPGFGKIPSKLVMGMSQQIEEYCIRYCQLISALEKQEPQGLREYRVEDWQNLIFPIGHARAGGA
jgi:hypothetical protein